MDYDRLLNRYSANLLLLVSETSNGDLILRYEEAIDTLKALIEEEIHKEYLDKTNCTDYWDVPIDDY